MKLRVVGWTDYEDRIEEGTPSWAARNVIIDDIKAHGYVFSGWSHQEGFPCVPVLNNGKMYCFSQRGWGGVMAEAHGYYGRMDYAKFAFGWDRANEIRPKEIFNKYNFTPERDLNERFELQVSQVSWDNAHSEHTIKLDDLIELRYLDVGDTLALVCGEQTAEFAVADVDRTRDLTEDELVEIETAYYDNENPEASKRAEEKYNNAKIVIVVKLKDN